MARPRSVASSRTTALSTSASTPATSSPPTSPNTPTTTMDSPAGDVSLDALEAAEARARLENERSEEEDRVAAARKKKRATRQHPETKAEREAKARELDELLKKSAAFSDILTKKTEVLGRVGSGVDGKTLGEHDLKMAKQPKCMKGGTMRDYQLEGLTWMYEICLQGMSGILADEMGLGKTVQTISLIALLREQEGYLGPHLIVAPLSTLSNWIDEFERWVPSIPVLLYHGTPAERAQLHRTHIEAHIKGGRPTTRFPVVCTSYEIILRDKSALSRINWEFIIIDEGHRMKNFDAKLFRELKQFRSATRLLITGTPLQNNLRELWSLLNFLLPEIFVNWDAFESWFDFSDLQDEEGTQEFLADRMKQDLVRKMHLILQPLLLRRIKADVASYLPKKREYVLFAPMVKEQTDLYNAINSRKMDTREFLEGKVVEYMMAAAARAEAAKKSDAKAASESEKADSKAKALGNGSKPVKALLAKDEAIISATLSSPQKKMPMRSVSQGTASTKNAFAMMMAKGKDGGSKAAAPKSGDGKVASKSKTGKATSPKLAAKVTRSREEPVKTPSLAETKAGLKRKAELSLSPAVTKSAKSTRQSTPAAGTRDRSRKSKSYAEADSDDDDLLDDDAFEAKLANLAADEEPVASTDDGKSEYAQMLEQAKKEVANKKLGNPIMQLRLVCNSPINFYNPFASSAVPVDETIVTSSGKMLLLDRLLPELFSRGHKVLIFSQFTTQIDILQDYCELRKWEACRIDGGVSQDSRREQIARFNSDPALRLFLLSTRAGGQGINLASADTVILFDSDWNPQQDLQAQDRAHRIGQTRPVIVYRLATKGTVEETLLLSADAKRRLEKLVIKKGGFRTMGQKMSRDGDDDHDGGLDGLLDPDALKALMLKDGEVYEYSGASEREVLSDADLRVLCDRSDAAYERAAAGTGNADGWRVIETGADGIVAAGEKKGGE